MSEKSALAVAFADVYVRVVILHGILTALAVLSFALTLWQWLAARRFPLHKRVAVQSPAPAVTLLKPLKGCDQYTEKCLRSWLTQDYRGEMQFLFAVAGADDPVCAIVKKLLAEFPERDAQLIICPERLGANAKISKLAQLEPRARHELLVISDADVWVSADLVANVVQPLVSPGSKIGLVNCFYELANPTTPAMRWEAVAVNADFWSQVLQGTSFQRMDYALGAVMATRRQCLAEIGGFRGLADCLADDYQLGHRIAQRGHLIELCPVVVQCWSAPMAWRAVWRHQLRWARTIRVCQAAPYFFSILANGTIWPLLWALADVARHPASGMTLSVPVSTIGLGVFLLFRVFTAYDLQRRLTLSSAHARDLWLVPGKDLLQAAIWASAFTGNRIEWRGDVYRLQSDGTLIKRESPAG